jgi:quinol monooxygenase YgiN
MSSPHVHVNMEWNVPISQTRPTTLALHAIAAETRTKRGCVGCSVGTDLSQRGTVRYAEEWLTEQDLRAQIQSDTFVQLIRLIEGAIEPPHIEFALPDHTRGLDFVDEVRSSGR